MRSGDVLFSKQCEFTVSIKESATRGRELRGFLAAMDKFQLTRGTIITLEDEEEITGWRQASSSIILGNFMDSQYKSVEVGDAFRLLEKAMLLELVYPTISVTAPIMPQIRRSPKLIWLDTGLVNYAAGIRKEVIGAKNIFDIWRGHIGEHIVAQELLTLNHKVSQRRNFWARDRKESAAEVDFIYFLDSKVYPIEVKTGNNSSLRSLHSFMDDSPLDIAVRVWSGPYSVDEVYTINKRKQFRLINLPFYLVCKIEQILRNIEA